MKQKQQNTAIMALLAINIVALGTWGFYTWLNVTGTVLTKQDWTNIGIFIFVIVDTIEIILLRRGQRAWTHEPGKTLCDMLVEIDKEMRVNKKARESFANFFYSAFQAGMAAMDETGEGPAARQAKIVLPDGMKQHERFVNQPWLKKKLLGMFKKDTKNQGKPDSETFQ